MRSSSSVQSTASSAPHNLVPPKDLKATESIIIILTIAVPVVVLGAIRCYQKHQTTRMQQRIQYLNYLWQLNSSENLS